jgi:protein phosphatase
LLQAGAVSDVGRVRKTNEDAFIADREVSLFAVADGMGGHDAGEVASALAIEAVSAFVRGSARDRDVSWPCGIDRSLSDDANRLGAAIHQANRRIFQTAEHNDHYSGMGTTLVAALMIGARMAVGHVGDSRVYLCRRGSAQQLTEDDSWAATILAKNPHISPEEIARHPMRNVLTNVLGARDRVDVHLSEHVLVPGDIVLLCSDGLHGVLDPEALAEIVAGQQDLQRAARLLVDAALERGSRDNITALLVRYDEAEL